MAKVEVIVIKCDKCGFEDTDPSKFLHVTVSPILPVYGGKKTASASMTLGKALSSRDLCIESCVGAPAVNRDR